MLYPLKFNFIYKDYLWGGRGLEKFGKNLPEGIVAESWEVSTHPNGESVVINGKYEGMPLTKLIKELKRQLIGEALPDKDVDKFPLLVKLIDANSSLSVQVHPDDEYAKVNENGEYGKNEMWYIAYAKPDAKIVYGVKEGITKEKFAQAVKDNQIGECLNYLEVQSGDAVNIPAGLVHAIGEGIIIAEIQQNSDTTYRVYDFDRVDSEGNKRPLHIEKALDVIDFNNCNTKGKLKGLKVTLDNSGSYKIYLVANDYFSVEKYNINGKIKEVADGSRFFIYTCLDGEGQIIYGDNSESVSKGESILIPADMGEYFVEGELELLKSYVPDLEKCVVKPLLNAGYEKEDISQVIF